jgi:hypothetical protein
LEGLGVGCVFGGAQFDGLFGHVHAHLEFEVLYEGYSLESASSFRALRRCQTYVYISVSSYSSRD